MKEKMMNKNEKGNAGNIALEKLENQSVSMKNHTTNLSKLQFNSTSSRAKLLEQSKLSRLPQRTPFRLPDFDNTPTNAVAVVGVCAGCNTRLDTEDALQIKFSGCRKCVSIYGRLDAAREENAKRETRELLEKFTGGAK
jgi:hypothetical protein